MWGGILNGFLITPNSEVHPGLRKSSLEFFSFEGEKNVGAEVSRRTEAFPVSKGKPKGEKGCENSTDFY